MDTNGVPYVGMVPMHLRVAIFCGTRWRGTARGGRRRIARAKEARVALSRDSSSRRHQQKKMSPRSQTNPLMWKRKPQGRVKAEACASGHPIGPTVVVALAILGRPKLQTSYYCYYWSKIFLYIRCLLATTFCLYREEWAVLPPLCPHAYRQRSLCPTSLNKSIQISAQITRTAG